jgi:thiamine biosynthesis lipoprotein
MATRFELVLYGPHSPALRAAGEEALDEIQRLDAQLSLYEPTSELAHLNARAAREPVRVEPGLFRLLARARQLSEETGGLFDLTIAPLMRCWGLLGGKGKVPEPAELEEARAQVGMHLVELDPERFTVRFARPGVMLDLGALGKGYAIERAGDILRELGVTAALLHGGTSTVRALGTPPDAPAWQVAIAGPPGAASQPLARVSLCDESLSVSAVWGKSFQAHGTTYGHIMDPRTGHPAAGAVLAAVVLPSATETDAFSTALLTAGLAGHEKLAGLRPGLRSLVAEPAADGTVRIASRGLATRAEAI